MNPSGGLFWHLHAWRYKSQWTATCADIALWLGQMPWAQQESAHTEELLILGASAGWMVPSAWLQRFGRVTTFDVDRWAAPLFQRRHGAALRASGTALRCHTQDALADLPALLSAHPRAVVLLDNVLGQLRFHHASVEAAAGQIQQITRGLHGRRWGSVHDAFSGRTQRRTAGSATVPMLHSPQAAKDKAAQPERRAVALAHFSNQLGAQGEWLDHLTDGVFPAGTVVHHIAWPYQPRYCHWLQAGWVKE